MGIVFRSKGALFLLCLLSLFFTLPSSATGTFTVSATPSSISIPENGQGVSTIATTIGGGFNSSIILSASGTPMGVTVSFKPPTIAAPGSGLSTMTITVAQVAHQGTYPITVTGSGGGIKQTTTVTLTVTASGQANFTILALPASLSIAPGTQGNANIYTTIGGSFNSSITLSASGVPAGTVVGFSPNPIAAPGAGSATMNITVGSSTPAGSYPITVTGNGGGIQQNTTVTLTVTAASGWQQGFDFRNTAAFVTDPPGDTYVLPTTKYPTTVNGVTFGWVKTNLVQGRDRKASLDPRLAGINLVTNGSPATFYVDLPSPGTYNLSLAMGDAGYQECWVQCQVQFLDGNTVLATLTTGVTGLGYFYDAAGNNWSAAVWPTSNVSQQVTLSGTRLTVVVGTNQTSGDTTPIAFLGLAQPSGSPNFTMSASPPSVTVQQGNQGTSTITTTISGGFNNDIALSASGAPSGTTVSFDPNPIPAPGSGSSTMTITVGNDTPVGTYPITVTGDGGGIEQNTTVTLTVTAQQLPNFTISAAPASLTIQQGKQGTSTITTTISGGFNSAIALSSSGAPSGTTVSFNPNPIPAPGSGSSTMTITVGGSTPVGTYPIIVTGNGGGIQQNTTVTLTVSAAANFTISASPASLTIQQGNQGTSTITTTISGGFNSPITLSSSGAPSGTTIGFNPNPIPAPGSGSSTMTITVGGSTPVGTYPITVTGNGGGIQQNTTVTLTVSAAGKTFTISASPASISIAQGNQGTSTITTTVSGGFNNSISLSASGMPMGVGVSFNPQTIPAPGSGTSTMTITVLRLAQQGTYPITVTGNGGGIQQHTTVTLTVTGPPDFELSASPASLTIMQRHKGTTTITSTINGGFNGAISLSASGVPSGVKVTFDPQTIPAPGSGNSTMTITVGNGALPGAYPITVTGSSGFQRLTVVTLTVTAAPNFVIGASPSSVSIAEGSQSMATITTLVCCGFNSSISLSASGVPPATSVIFNPGTIPAPGSGSSTMTMTVGKTTPTGIYPITVTGSGGGLQYSATVTLTVTGGQAPSDAKFMEPYSYALQSSFGQPPYSYQVSSGSLPGGLTINQAGQITGTANVVGNFPFQVLATDSSQPPQQQSSNYTLNVVIGFDTYSGLTAAPVPGCTKTNYFQLQKAKGRWVYASPSCNAFYQFAVYDADPGFILGAIFQGRYGGDSTKWATHSLQREQAYGFDANDIFASDYMLPITRGGNGDGASIKLPFLLFFATTNDAIVHPSMIGLPEAVKDLCAGQDSNGYGSFCNYTLDIVDPNWLVGNQGELALQISQFTDGFNTSPWVLAISLGDADELFMFKGNGSGLSESAEYPHPAMVVATSAFNYNLPPVNGNWQRPILYSKVGWACNAAANDPTNFPPGQSYLEKKYGNIAALNRAWGTGNFYTSFCDAGGFGSGTGVLDEDGRHTAWFGSDYFNQAGMNANLKADLDKYLYMMAYQIYYPQSSVVRSYDTNHLLMCGFYGGSGDGGMRPVVAQALKDAGCQVLVLNWNSTYPSGALASNQATYDQLGLPVTLFYGSTAQADSDYSQYPNNGAYLADFPTQESRAQHYDSDNQAIYGSQGSNGDYYALGIDFWSLTDNSSEDRNWGFISISDNVYDGNCAVILASIDPWGYPCGGEAANYGDFTDGVTQANSTLLQQLIMDLLQ